MFKLTPMLVVWSFTFFFMCLLFKNVETKMITMLTIIFVYKTSMIDHFYLESSFFFLDEMATSMSFLSIILSCISIVIYTKMNDDKKILLCTLSGIMAFMFFHCSNMMFFFITFEASLIPLMFLMVGWGKQPERMMASKYIMLYTLVSSFPFLIFTIMVEEEGMFSMLNPSIHQILIWPSTFNLLVSISFFLSFLVKVPMFFLHSWLPKAHVEAPLEGSIILAGIMLKVGTFGIFRMFNSFPPESFKWMVELIFCISILGSVISMASAISSDDMKILIALSSISHMNFLLSGMMSLKELSVHMTSFIMISHGLVSSTLFFFVTIIYETFNTRSLILVKGSMSKFPSMIIMSFLFFFLATALPPSLPFIGEMLIISSVAMFSNYSLVMVFLFIVLNSFFSMMSFGMMNQSAKSKTHSDSKMMSIFNLTSMSMMIILFSSFFSPEIIY